MQKTISRLSAIVVMAGALAGCSTPEITRFNQVTYPSNQIYTLPVTTITINPYQDKFFIKNLPFSLSEEVSRWTKTYLKTSTTNGTATVNVTKAQLRYQQASGVSLNHKIIADIEITIEVSSRPDSHTLKTNTIKVRAGGHQEILRTSSITERDKAAYGLMERTLHKMDLDLRKQLATKFPQ